MNLPLTVSLDLEDHRLGRDPSTRYLDNAARILDFFAANNIQATIFVVGDIIDDCAELLRRAQQNGHELALHSATHTPLTMERREPWKRALREAKLNLENLTGSQVIGFRAPVFSLTPASQWTTEVLAELEFGYSSSVLPAAHPLYGYPGAPRTPFRWPSGIVEFPVPLARVLGSPLPYLGGIYLRYLPLAWIKRQLRKQSSELRPWSFMHPYDIDADEGYYRFPGTSALQSVLLWRRRSATLERLSALLESLPGGCGPSFASLYADEEFASLPLWPSDCANDLGETNNNAQANEKTGTKQIA